MVFTNLYQAGKTANIKGQVLLLASLGEALALTHLQQQAYFLVTNGAPGA